ncbi:TPA: hypothetical protein N0F65_003317 [Lagenidium giganteum]|uniref:RNase H type-1 domain-containing protein n=1 Tax=Lagenidium giganteum TaxID=4803 RepID=A0AAV2ZB13_9STRA|nr:TPA: hypothetical protein N0F65_003317 [Lagenidium giganteum]
MQIILFRYGAARGNHGPAAAGVATDTVSSKPVTPARVEWIGTSYFQQAITNNTAEYSALLFRLRHASKACLRPLHVVGDSKMIINQMTARNMPGVVHLQKLHVEARQLADTHPVVSWSHHDRSYNKMADAAAKIAHSGMPPGRTRAVNYQST